MSQALYSPVEILEGRGKHLSTTEYSYKLQDGSTAQYALDAIISELKDSEIDESKMSVVIPYADGNRRESERHVNVSPGLPVNDVANGGTGYSIPSPDGFLTLSRCVSSEDIWYVRFLDLGTALSFALGSPRWANFNLPRTLNVYKAFPSKDVEDRAFANTQPASNGESAFSILVCPVDFFDMRILEFGVSNLFPLTTGENQSSVLDAISHVSSTSVPPDIVEIVVGGVPVREVAAFHSLWTRSDECQQDEAVDSVGLVDVSLTQVHMLSSSTVGENVEHHPFDRSIPSAIGTGNFSGERFDSATVANSIKTLEFGEVSPVFFGSVRMPFDSLIELLGSEGITFSHCPSPVKNLQSIESGQAVWKPLFGNDPSPSYSRDSSRNGKGVAA